MITIEEKYDISYLRGTVEACFKGAIKLDFAINRLIFEFRILYRDFVVFYKCFITLSIKYRISSASQQIQFQFAEWEVSLKNTRLVYN